MFGQVTRKLLYPALHSHRLGLEGDAADRVRMPRFKAATGPRQLVPVLAELDLQASDPLLREEAALVLDRGHTRQGRHELPREDLQEDLQVARVGPKRGGEEVEAERGVVHAARPV